MSSALLLPALSACTSPQSTFTGAGLEAAQVETLFWVMLVGAVVVWFVTVGLSVYATKVRPGRHSEKTGLRLIVWGGAVFPTVVLSALLVYGLKLMPEFRAGANGPTIAVSGERFWFRVAYAVEGEPGVVKSLPPGGVESANEIWLPVGRRSELLLGSPDVIHSFWVPSIAGKMDMIPGRVNRLVVEPRKEGVYNGVCTEFCGDAHAEMGFRVVVVSQDAYDAYVSAQAEPARITSGPGYDTFMENGCDACHSVRGTAADGAIGPDLTHMGSRLTIAAGILENTPTNVAQFIRATDHVKQGVEMPAYGVLPEADIVAIAAWLEQLK
ncbi:c-type cytochrome [Fulvimarina sp. 2208YS6-2-32]|uniref:C-type cytochrome n=1 Tax=Fulvimarina uroteuthidis TaxID=3098149 RepID=A0ABU5I130_9HYPH|nr:c-type cytochrome [Fulvimarina sp. 2208YS6-2-32]MDY8109095.1 c-type cytochrome [Fulvimarina sp. 2208YS6-2-32]